MLQPKRVRYTKVFTRLPKGVSSKAVNIAFGEYGIKSLENGYITSNQVEAVRMAISKYIKRRGKVWIRVFPDLPVTAKPTSRMGGGKSPIDKWKSVVKKGRIIFEIGGVEEEMVLGAFEIAKHKLPLKVKLVTKQNG